MSLLKRLAAVFLCTRTHTQEAEDQAQDAERNELAELLAAKESNYSEYGVNELFEYRLYRVIEAQCRMHAYALFSQVSNCFIQRLKFENGRVIKFTLRSNVATGASYLYQINMYLARLPQPLQERHFNDLYHRVSRIDATVVDFCYKMHVAIDDFLGSLDKRTDELRRRVGKLESEFRSIYYY